MTGFALKEKILCIFAHSQEAAIRTQEQFDPLLRIAADESIERCGGWRYVVERFAEIVEILATHSRIEEHKATELLIVAISVRAAGPVRWSWN